MAEKKCACKTPNPNSPLWTPNPSAHANSGEDIHIIRSLATKADRQDYILHKHPLPPHWRKPPREGVLGKICRTLFNILCITAFGYPGLEGVWSAIRLEETGDGSVWEDGVRRTTERLNNMLLVGGLLLASAAAFLTTEPPRQEIANYTLRGPYICVFASFGLLIGGIIVGSVSLLVTGRTRTYWLEQVLLANRFHVYCTLITLSYPFFSIGIAALLLAFGLLSGVWSAEDHRIKGAASLMLILPVSMGILFGVSCATAAGVQSKLRKERDLEAQRGDQTERHL